MTAPLPLAHAGHVIADSLMFVPVLVLALWFVVVAIRDRRRDRRRDAAD